MIDLHLHIDGSLTKDFVRKQADKLGMALPESETDLQNLLGVSRDCTNLVEYLDKFELPLTLLQTQDAISESIYTLLKELNEQELTGAELRFAPQLHTVNGLSQLDVVEAALDGLRRAETDFSIRSGLILCCMRNENNEKENMETVEVAKSTYGNGVLALDLAGAESLYPTKNFRSIFAKANSYDIPYTIHAGEAAGCDSIWNALEMGALRIGHGIACIQDVKLMDHLANKQIPLEMCPTSNVQTCCCETITSHPILRLLEQGLCVTCNTDNMTVSNTTLALEFDELEEKQSMTQEQRLRLEQNALKASFLSI